MDPLRIPHREAWHGTSSRFSFTVSFILGGCALSLLDRSPVVDALLLSSFFRDDTALGHSFSNFQARPSSSSTLPPLLFSRFRPERRQPA